MNGSRPNPPPHPAKPVGLQHPGNGNHGPSSAHRPVPAQSVQAEPEPIELEEPLELIDEPLEIEQGDEKTAKKIIAFGVDGGHRHDKWTRQPVITGKGACRMRSFHGKLSEQGMEYLDNAVNDWLDHHPEIEVKFVTSNVGMFDGKMKEPSLILNIWY